MKPEKFQAEIKSIIRGMKTPLKDKMYDDHEFSDQLEINAMALAGEAGEVADYVKKYLWYNNPKIVEDLDDVMEKELGDVLYHVAEIANVCDLDLGVIMQKVVDRCKEKNNMP